jgi:hypothetical protein
MEQQLVNALMKLFAKAGGGSLIRDMIRMVDENGNPKVWTRSETEAAIQYVTWQTENFGTAEAAAMVENLMKKFNLNLQDFDLSKDTLTDKDSLPGVQGLN